VTLSPQALTWVDFMQRISLNNISLEIPSVVGGGDPDPFHKDAVWSIYDGAGNILSAQKQTLFTLGAAVELAVEIAAEQTIFDQVTIRWEGESIQEMAFAIAGLSNEVIA
jgi:hypothetical protein